ncbi:YwqJ-related putative deaminase [Paenibacillus sp. chi10]|uniref:YwqJ-related putative deaminase n=1 Tax=Paenibacillus suaedae TaxID=3077233 RepID=A0AAJ2K2D1_9BACL|nr:YwqJ-related putative deaminase [Paenibacillus sp. chi10]MDT8979325.1 YwqJ-related putative deaminase [Paenibacillus sp. chi10]
MIKSRGKYLREKYGQLSSQELHQRINLRGAVHKELNRLKNSHAEVRALNRALLARPDADIEEFMIFVISARKINKKMPIGTPMPRCPHCEYITKGTHFIPEVLKHNHGR